MIDTDASGLGIGGVLLQTTDGRNYHVVEYASRMLKPDERKLDTTCREALAILHCLKRFRPYVYGRKFVVRTDHDALKHIVNLPDPHGKLSRWQVELANYDMQIIHRKGQKMQHVDCLSRYPVRRLTVPLVRASVQAIQDEEDLMKRASGGNAQVFSKQQREDPKLMKIF